MENTAQTIECIKQFINEQEFYFVRDISRGEIIYAIATIIREAESGLKAPCKDVSEIWNRLIEIEYEMLDNKHYKKMKCRLLNESNDSVMTQTILQCFECYERQLYYACACGLLPLIERCIVSDVSAKEYNWKTLESSLKTKNGHLISANKEKNIQEYTIRFFVRKLSAKVPFSSDEPNNLNRHWLLHGRSNRVPTKIDCLKLFNIIDEIADFPT